MEVNGLSFISLTVNIDVESTFAEGLEPQFVAEFFVNFLFAEKDDFVVLIFGSVFGFFAAKRISFMSLIE